MIESDLRVPTLALPAEVIFADGRSLSGSLFLPASSADHGGPMTAVEHLNSVASFLAFLPDDVEIPVILNKAELVAVGFEPQGPAGEDDPTFVERRVVLECGGRRLEGVLSIDAMQGQSRILDFLNRAERFLSLRDDARHYLVHRDRITRVIEVHDE